MLSVSVQNITKTYNNGKTMAISDISFEVEAGEIFGLIGPDGAGKTSLFRILTTLLLPDTGKAQVCGFDVIDDYKSIRNTVGYMPGKFSLTSLVSKLFGISRIRSALSCSINLNASLKEVLYPVK